MFRNRPIAYWYGRQQYGWLDCSGEGRLNVTISRSSGRSSSLDAYEYFITSLIDDHKGIVGNEIVERLIEACLQGRVVGAAGPVCRADTGKAPPSPGTLRLTGMAAPFVYNGNVGGNG